ARCIPEPEDACDLLPQPARREIVARERALLGVPEQALVEDGRALEQLEQPLAPAALAIGLRIAVLVLELDAEPAREHLDRADEVEVVQPLHERDRIAALAAAEALERAARGRDGEARRPLL